MRAATTRRAWCRSLLTSASVLQQGTKVRKGRFMVEESSDGDSVRAACQLSASYALCSPGSCRALRRTKPPPSLQS